MMEIPFPPQVRCELPGWLLFWADLELLPDADGRLEALRSEVGERVRQVYRLETLGEQPTVAAVRRLFRQAGCDPTRYRPASEALLRRIRARLGGDERLIRSVMRLLKFPVADLSRTARVLYRRNQY